MKVAVLRMLYMIPFFLLKFHAVFPYHLESWGGNFNDVIASFISIPPANTLSRG